MSNLVNSLNVFTRLRRKVDSESEEQRNDLAKKDDDTCSASDLSPVVTNIPQSPDEDEDLKNRPFFVRVISGTGSQWSHAGAELDYVLENESEFEDDSLLESTIRDRSYKYSNYESETVDGTLDGQHRRHRRSRHGRRVSRKHMKSPVRLTFCGAIEANIIVSDEVEGSFQDANVSLRQIVSTVRSFGPDEREAVRETLQDATQTLKQAFGPAFSCRRRSRGDN